MLSSLLSLRKGLTPLRASLLQFRRRISMDDRFFQTDIFLKRNGRVSLENFEELRNSASLSADKALLLLRCCGELLPDQVPEKRHEMMLGLKSRLKPPVLDLSHANASLLVQNENGIRFNPSEALEEIRSMGLEPNRVTYQHLIERYASEGDVQSASTILSHMKEQEMPVNEWIFGSLITAHCLKGDIEGAKGVLEVMKESGLEAGSEAHATFITGVIKSSKDLSKDELINLIEDAKLKEITFCDHDIFRILSAASSTRRTDLYSDIVSYLPKRNGFYQEMRNRLPGLIFNGDVDFAVDLFMDFASNIMKDDTGLSKRLSGDFIPVAMVRSGGKYPTSEIERVARKVTDDNPGQALSECVLAAIDEGYKDLAKELREILFSNNLYDRRSFIPYIRRKSQTIIEGSDIKDKLFDLVARLFDVGVYPAMQSLSTDILPPLIKMKSTMDGRSILVVRELLNGVKDRCGKTFPYSDVGNACVQYHLNKENETSFVDALRIMTNIKTEWLLPVGWKISLAKSYLATDNISYLSAAFFYCLRDQLKSGVLSNRNATVWDVIPLIHSLAPRYVQNKDPDIILRDVLKHLASQNLVPPSGVSSSWKRSVEDPSTLEFLDSLVEPTTWSEEADEAFDLNVFQNIFGKSKRDTNLTEFKGKETHENLVKLLAEENYINAAEVALREMKVNDFSIVPNGMHDLISGLCGLGETSKALEIFKLSMTQERSRVYAATASNLLGHLLCTKNDDVWRDLLSNTLQKDKLIVKPGVNIEDYFASASLHLDEVNQSDKLSEVKSILRERGIVESRFNFVDDEGRNRYKIHRDVTALLSENEVIKAYEVFKEDASKGGVIYGGTVLLLASALSKNSNNIELLKEFLSSLSEERVHSRQAWSGFFTAVLNASADSWEDPSTGYDFIDNLVAQGTLPSNTCKAYYTFKMSLLLKENKTEEALGLFLEAGENDVLIKNQEIMKIFAESEDLENLQKALDVSIGILGEVNALYGLIRCFLDLGKYPQVKKLLETPGFRYVSANVESLVEHLIRSENPMALENFINYSRNLFACDRDYLYSKLLHCVPASQRGEKASEIWINLQEEGHIPSSRLKSQIAEALRSAGKYVPFSEEQFNTESQISTPSQKRVVSPLLNSLAETQNNPEKSYDFLSSLNEFQRNELLSSKSGINTFANILKTASSDDLSRYESLFSEKLRDLFFMKRRLVKALIEERKVNIVDSIKENPDCMPTVKVVSDIINSDVETAQRMYDLKDTLTDGGRAILLTAFIFNGHYSYVKDSLDSVSKNGKVYALVKRYLRGNTDMISDIPRFLEDLKRENLLTDLGGPVYSYLLERDPHYAGSKDDISNLVLDMLKNKIELRGMSTSALKICAENCEDEILKRTMTSIISERN